MTEGSPRTATFGSGDSRLLIDYAARSVYVDADEVSLTPTEFDVLACLARRAGTVVSTPDIVESVWGEWFGPMDHVFVHVHHIRRKLGPCGKLIVTKRKAGYLMRVEPDLRDPTSPWPQITREYSDLLQEDARSRGSIWILADRDRLTTWVSDSITTHLGWAPGDLIGKHPWVIAPQEEVAEFERRFPLRGGSALVSFETRVRHVDGYDVDIHVHGQVIMGADGHRLGGIGEWRILGGEVDAAVSSDERRAVPFRLHYDSDHVLTGVEPHQAFLGWDPDEVIGTYFSLAGLDRGATERAMGALVALGHDHELHRTLVLGADGTPALVDMRLLLTVEEGVLTGYVGEVRVLD